MYVGLISLSYFYKINFVLYIYIYFLIKFCVIYNVVVKPKKSLLMHLIFLLIQGAYILLPLHFTHSRFLLSPYKKKKISFIPNDKRIFIALYLYYCNHNKLIIILISVKFYYQNWGKLFFFFFLRGKIGESLNYYLDYNSINKSLKT